MGLGSKVTFRRIGGRIVPIAAGGIDAVTKAKRSATPALQAATVATAVHTRKENTSKVGANFGLKAFALGANVVSGVVAGLTLSSGFKVAALGQGASLGLDVASAAANATAHARAGGSKRERTAAFARSELLNNVVGYGSFAGAAVATKAGRAQLKGYAETAVAIGKNVPGAALTAADWARRTFRISGSVL